jgi:two-component system phosphate regulon response regulator PhoB
MAKKILVIEDDKDIRDAVVEILEQEEFEVISSDNARILKSLNTFNPDLILLDNWLTEWKSDANGEQLSKELKSNPETSHIPVIIMSAVSNIKEVAEAGMANAYIKKPFDLTELVNLINKYIL